MEREPNMHWQRPEPVTDYDAFERGEPIETKFDFAFDNVKAIKLRVRAWLKRRGFTRVKFRLERRGSLYPNILIAYWTFGQQRKEMFEAHPAHVFFKTGSYEHKLQNWEIVDPASAKKIIIRWLKANGAPVVNSRIDRLTGYIHFWNPLFDPEE